MFDCYSLVMTNSLLLKMAIEIVDLPIKNGDSPYSYVTVYQRVAYIRPKNKGYGTNVPPHQRILEISH